MALEKDIIDWAATRVRGGSVTSYGELHQVFRLRTPT
jgi:hypothetical protein